MTDLLHPIVIPDSVATARQPNPRNPVEPEAMHQFDAKTLFYDVFIDTEHSRLVAIGPPALNLAYYVDASKLTINGQATKFHREELPEQRISLLTARLPAGDKFQACFAFADFEMTLELLPESRSQPRNVLAAISKNNRTRWIIDWVDFYSYHYPLDEIIVYDNSSVNVQDLESEICGKAKIIRWNFPFGPSGKTINNFAQTGALNHCLHRFVGDGVLFNFDIDELLVADSEQIMTEVARHGILYFESYNMPFVPPDNDDYSYKDFVHRYAERKNTARKFVCRGNAVDIISQHNTWTYRGALFWKRLKRNKPASRTSASGYFLHFLGITTNWQPRLNKFKEVSPQELVFEDAHISRRPARPATDCESSKNHA